MDGLLSQLVVGGVLSTRSRDGMVEVPRLAQVGWLRLSLSMRGYDAALEELERAHAAIPSTARRGDAPRLELRPGSCSRLSRRVDTVELELYSVRFIDALAAVESAWAELPQQAQAAMAVDLRFVADGAVLYARVTP